MCYLLGHPAGRPVDTSFWNGGDALRREEVIEHDASWNDSCRSRGITSTWNYYARSAGVGAKVGEALAALVLLIRLGQEQTVHQRKESKKKLISGETEGKATEDQ